MIALRRLSFFASACVALGAASCSSSVDHTQVGALDGGGSDGSWSLGDGDDGGPAFALNSLVLTPSNAIVYLDTATTPASPGTQTYKAVLNASDGTSTDVSSQVTFTLDDNTIGGFSGATFTSAGSLPGGKLVATTVVHAAGAGQMALANLTVVQLRNSGPQQDFFFTIPYQVAPTPAKRVLGFATDLKNADVAFSVDTTGSMGGSIANLRSGLVGMFPKLVAAIPSVGLAVVDFKDSGQGDPWVVNVRQPIDATASAAAKATAAANGMNAGGGGDDPEADIASLTYIATGSYPGTNPAIATHTAVAPLWGGVDFRPGSVPIVVNVTDAPWKQNMDGIGPISQAITALTAKNMRFVNVLDQHPQDDGTEAEGNQVSDATNSNVAPSAFGTSGQCPTGQGGANRPPTGPGGTCRLNFLIMDGAPLTGQVVTAISAIAVGSKLDITAVPSNDPANAGGVDATKFIASLRAMDEGDATEGCPAVGLSKVKDTNGDGIADTFIQIVANKSNRVCFEVDPKENTTVVPTADAQVFRAYIDVVGMPGAFSLGDRREVLFLVPPKDINAQ